MAENDSDNPTPPRGPQPDAPKEKYVNYSHQIESARESLRKLRREQGEFWRERESISQKEIEILETKERLQLEGRSAQAIRNNETVRQHEKELEALKDSLEVRKQYNEIVQDGVKAGEGFAESLGLVTTGFVKQIMTQSTANKKIGIFNTVMGTAKGRLLGFAGALASLPMGLIGRTFDAVKALDDLAAGFVKNTGLAREFAYEAFALRTQVSHLGITQDAVVAAGDNLITNFTLFNQLNEDTRASLEILTAKFDALGADIVPVLSFAVQGLGLSLDEATDLTQDLYTAADLLGKPVTALIDEFSQLSDVVAYFGDQGMEAFLDIQNIAESTGISVQALAQTFGAEGLFSTFESAAETGQRLNALVQAMGGTMQLDPISLMGQSVETVREALLVQFRSIGQDFMQIDRHLRREFARTAQLGEAEAARFFRTTSQVAAEAAAEASAAAELNEETLRRFGVTQEQFDERVASAATNIDRLKESIRNLTFAVAPLLEPLSKVVDWFGRGIQVVSQFIQGLDRTEMAIAGIAGTAGAGVGLWGLTSAVGALVGGIVGSAGSAGLVGALGVGGLGAVLGVGGTVLTGVLLGVGALTLAFMGLGYAFEMTGRGVLQIATAMTQLSAIEDTSTITELFGALGDIPKGRRYVQLGRGLSRAFNSISAVSPAQAVAATMLVQAAADVSVQSDNNALLRAVEALPRALTRAFENITTNSGVQGDIIIQMGNTEVGRVLRDQFNRDMQLSAGPVGSR
jgi:hypothetical protein